MAFKKNLESSRRRVHGTGSGVSKDSGVFTYLQGLPKVRGGTKGTSTSLSLRTKAHS